MAGRTRRGEMDVPTHHLNYVVDAPSSSNDWHAVQPNDMNRADLYPTDQIRALFHQRQRYRRGFPTRTSLHLKFPEQWPCGLQQVHITGRDLKIKKIDKLQEVRINQTGAIIGRAERNPRRIDPEWFDQTVNEVKQRIHSMESEPWIRSAVFYPLGPKNILQALGGCFFARKYCLVVNPNNALAYLVMESFGNSEDDTEAIENFLKLSSTRLESEMVSTPNAGYSMIYSYGEQPKLVSTLSNSTVALVFDLEYLKEKRHNSRATHLTPEKFYQYHFGCPVRFSRRLSDPEKAWLEKKVEMYNFRDHPLRMLQFYTVEDRNAAVQQSRFEFLDVLFCDSMFNYKDPTEQLHLYVTYSEESKQDEMVQVTLSAERDKIIAENAFRAHNLRCRYFNDKKVEDRMLRYDRSHKKIILSGFPKHLTTFEGKRWLVERITSSNNIRLISIEPFTENVYDAEQKLSRAKNKKLNDCIEKEIYRIGHCHNIYRPISWEWIWDLQRALEAGNLLEMVKQREDVPWKIFRNNRGPMQYLETYTVHFPTVPTGLRFVEHILEEASNTSLFSADESDKNGPMIVPCFRKSITISRALRYALRQTIRSFDRYIRQFFSALSQNEDVMMESPEATYYGARLCEEWNEDRETGVLEIQGWNAVSVGFFMRNLLRAMDPLELVSIPACPPDENAQLFFGVGENYVRSLPKKYDGNVVVDIDQFSQKIRLWGLAAEEALEDLRSYSTNKSDIVIEVAIPVHFPHFNDRLRDFLDRKVIDHFRRSLDIKKLEEGNAGSFLRFEGTIEAYEKLIEGLTELSAAVFNREIDGNKDLEESQREYQCTCTVPGFARINDFYRLHCGHVFCRTCLSSCINSSIGDAKLLIECPNDACKKFITPKELMDLVLGDGRRLKDIDSEKLSILVNKTKDAIIAADPEIKNCNTADCIGINTKEKGDIKELKKCTACRRPYCRRCLCEAHGERTCEEALRLQNPDEALKMWIEEAGDRVGHCPVKECNWMMEKGEGCNHMQCPKCSIHFCWTCGFTSDESGPIYAHMTSDHEENELEDYVVDDDERDMQEQLVGLFMAGNMDNEAPDGNGIGEGEFDGQFAELLQNQALNRRRNPTPPPPPPRRPRRLERLPDVVLDRHPNLTEEDEEVYLNFLNAAATREDQDERIRELAEDIPNR
ncbi:hypothetical protein B9Z55_023679 [Caenorhabditis nigoni]|uniref:RING-type domain-containing protein n=1 Tax=Caenorhabditis nigoni TaxID=1611254 RepID=A0A2G5SRG4_9PELO|nr:hypothetical protein B9Z55_023679 [Caenorhabditis nigoni]